VQIPQVTLEIADFKRNKKKGLKKKMHLCNRGEPMRRLDLSTVPKWRRYVRMMIVQSEGGKKSCRIQPELTFHEKAKMKQCIMGHEGGGSPPRLVDGWTSLSNVSISPCEVMAESDDGGTHAHYETWSMCLLRHLRWQYAHTHFSH